MQLLIDRQGQVRCIYGEAIDLAALGTVSIHRASFVEPDAQGNWSANLSPVGGPTLGPFSRRSEALEAELAWLQKHWLASEMASFFRPAPARRQSCRRGISRARCPAFGRSLSKV
jgi:hypothetical protein